MHLDQISASLSRIIVRRIFMHRAFLLALFLMATINALNAQSSSEFEYHLKNNTCEEFIRRYEPDESMSKEEQKEKQAIVDLMKMFCGKTRHMDVPDFKRASNSMGFYFERKSISEYHALLTLRINNEYIYILENLDQKNGYSFRIKGSYSSAGSNQSSESNIGLSCNEYVFIDRSKVSYKFTFEIIKSNPYCL